jgi:hypothetical protein
MRVELIVADWRGDVRNGKGGRTCDDCSRPHRALELTIGIGQQHYADTGLLLPVGLELLR